MSESALASTIASFPVADIDENAMLGTPFAPIVDDIALLRTVVVFPLVKAVLIDDVSVLLLIKSSSASVSEP